MFSPFAVLPKRGATRAAATFAQADIAPFALPLITAAFTPSHAAYFFRYHRRRHLR